MSNRYKGAIISATPPTTTGGETGVASGAWTLEQQMQLQAAGLWPSPYIPKYIEEVFSCFLYTGNDSSQTITNGVNLSANGGLVWIKARTATYSHILSDTVRGTGKFLSSNTTDAQGTDAQDVTAFNTTGFTVGNNSRVNNSSFTYASWTFRKQPKFFDVVTYTGNSTARTIAHNLGSVPGCIIIKRTDVAGEWRVWHRGLATPNTELLYLNRTDASAATTVWSTTSPTATEFSLTDASSTNANNGTFVAYLFAHDAGGFGLSGTDNVISCGSFTTDGSGNATVNLGYEPQWLLIKNSSAAGYPWYMFDSMRGLTVGGNDRMLQANLNFAEENNNIVEPSATGFSYGVGPASNTFIYITIRRGPMKVPTTGTTIYDAQYAYSSPNTYRSTLTVDTAIQSSLDSALNHQMYTRLTGTNYLVTNDTAVQVSNASARFDTQTGFNTGVSTPPAYFAHLFRRAPSVHDVVCYTGTGVARTVTHNLAAVPELLIIKSRSQVIGWNVWSKSGTQRNDYKASLNTAGDYGSTGGDLVWGTPASGAPNMTSTTFSLGDYIGVNNSGSTYVAYLFATCAGVSKVGSYTGTATTKQIDCGFTGGARFVLIKRTDSTGDWYVWDSARGIVAGNDPYLLLNSTAAEVTNTDYIDTYSAGFEISSTAPAAINANGGTFIFLAIA